MKSSASPAVFMLLFALGCGGGGLAIVLLGWLPAWHLMGVDSLYPPFADLRTVLSAPSAVAFGLDPQILNPGDPWRRPMNYPAIWLGIFRVLGVNTESAYIAWVGGMVVLYLGTCLVFLRKYPSVWALAGMFSGAGLLAIERGNSDLLMFSVLFASSMAPFRVAGLLVMSAAILKVYPAFALMSLLRARRVALAVAVGLLTWGLLDLHELQKIRLATPANASFSYGAASIAAGLKTKAGLVISAWWISAVLMVFSAVLFFARRTRVDMLKLGAQPGTVRPFMVGASVYVLTFIMSSNWDYRLIFLTLCVPYLVSMSQRVFSRAVLAGMVLACNQVWMVKAAGVAGLALNIGAKCFVFVLLAALLAIEVVKAMQGRQAPQAKASSLHELQAPGGGVEVGAQVGQDAAA
jgi:hypothetical protein